MKRILIVDDDAFILESTKKTLEPFFEVDTSTSCSGALELAQNKTYYGLITDVDFGGGMNGLELISRIRTIQKELFIMVVSGIHYSDAVRQQTVELGASFTERPLTLEFVRRIMEVN